VARSAAVPRVRPPGVGLVSANARLNIAAVTAGAGAAALGSGVAALVGSGWVLRLASLLLIAGAVLSLRLPSHVDEAADRTTGHAPFRLLAARPVVTGPLATAIALRALAGLLTIVLAFFLRAEGASTLLIASVVGAAAVGQLAGTSLAARLPETSCGMLTVATLAAPLVACLGAALTAGAPWVVAAAATTGFSASLSKFALDAALQEHVPGRSMGTAFSRAETGLQLAWVVGGALAVAVPTVAGLGFGLGAALPVLGVLLARRFAQRAVAD
jgi:hypothetical protein